MRDHGGNLDAAMAAYGGTRAEWLDLSTGINPVPYPLPPLPQSAWAALPTRAEMAELAEAAARAYGTRAKVVPLAGASQAIALAPLLRAPGRARILGPTYNEHAGALAALGWEVTEVASLAALRGADLAVVVNPNNPDGACHPPEALVALSGDVGLLVIDESFADAAPHLSVLPMLDAESAGVLVQRSFGKFYGLAGLRLGFAVAGEAVAARVAELAGPWPVAGPAITVARCALDDTVWQAETCARLSADAARLDALAAEAGWGLVGGTALFRTYETGAAAAAQEGLARRRIWTRRFSFEAGWLRLGLPGSADAWARMGAGLAEAGARGSGGDRDGSG